ncbi:MAG: O-antigen ligase family protein, partial [Anaerolineae bacterium]|nr:O-antigen ligase family protein [Caldilineales bacterium]MDW8269447.1 O-antigen ligase family protein [Anaerolineae bacterium]
MTGVVSPTTGVVLVALAAVPVFFNIQSTTSFEPDKGALLRGLAALAGLGMLAEFWNHRRSVRWPIRPAPAWVALAAVLAVSVLTTATALDPVTALWGSYERGQGLLAVATGSILLVCAYRAGREGQVWWVVDAALIGCALPALYGLLQVAGFDPVTAGTVSFALGARASATAGNPNFLADGLLMGLVLAMARLALGPTAGRAQRWGLIGYIGVLAAALAATGSRSGLLAAITALAVLLLARSRQHGRAWARLAGLAVLAAGGLLLGLAWVAPSLLPPRLADLFSSGGTGGQRLLFWQGVIAMLADHPRSWLLGLGPDNLPLGLAPYVPAALAHFEPDWVFRIPDRAHTYALDLLAAFGLPGLAAWTLLWSAVVAALLPTWRRRGIAVALPILTAAVLAVAAAGTAGPTAAPLGFAAGWVGGVLLVLLLAPSAPTTPMAPYLLAALVGHWVMLAFHFPTHAADLLFWPLLGLSLALRDNPPLRSAPADLTWRLAGLAVAVFGFDLSAAWGRGVWLWLAAWPMAYLVAWLLTPPTPFSTRQLLGLAWPTVLLAPAWWLNRLGGMAAWPAFAWMLVVLLGQALFVLPTSYSKRPLPALPAVVIALLLSLPVFGDIALKAAILHPADAAYRRAMLAWALALSPYDHMVVMALAPTEMQALPATAGLDHPQAQAIAALYRRGLAAQPRAYEPLAAYAEWLRQMATRDPQAIPLARSYLDRALAWAPQDLQTRN